LDLRVGFLAAFFFFFGGFGEAALLMLGPISPNLCGGWRIMEYLNR
jgi:hypothetical protein